MDRFDVCVRGAGVVGRALALALARLGLGVALAAERSVAQAAAPKPDVRAYALNAASVALLTRLKVWDALPPQAVTAVHEMRVAGDARGAIEFSAWQQCVGALAWIVDAARLDDELAAAVRFAPHVETVAADALVDAPLVALCEGRDSPTRRALGVAMDVHPYGQRAIAARLVAERPHAGVARQWFRAPDVLALLPADAPVAGRSYALVWSLPDAEAARLGAVDAAGFDMALNDATSGACGHLAIDGERASWPLAVGVAERWVGPGWALVGDAAHVVHPLAGQGLNLGLADVDALARTIEARETWRGVGDPRLLNRYARERAAPTRAMVRLTDGLVHLFATDLLLVRELRNRGLALLDHLSPLKRRLAAQAFGRGTFA